MICERYPLDNKSNLSILPYTISFLSIAFCTQQMLPKDHPKEQSRFPMFPWLLEEHLGLEDT